MNNVRIFVYGSLLKGEGNERFCPVESRKAATLTEEAAIFDLGPFPAVVLKRDDPSLPFSTLLKGEVLEVTEDRLPLFDRLEGFRHEPDPHKNLYIRKEVMVEDEDKEKYSAFIYVMTGQDLTSRFGGKLTELDDWRNRPKEALKKGRR